MYKTTLQGFLRDAAFWTDLSGTVDFFAQEVYADSRSWGVLALANERARYLNDYLQHLIELAEAGADDIAPARSFLRETYLPLASAAWPWKTAFGDTDMPAEEMQYFVSTQTFAIRHYARSHPQSAPANRIGFAYAPNPAAAGPASPPARSSTASPVRCVRRTTAAARRSGSPWPSRRARLV